MAHIRRCKKKPKKKRIEDIKYRDHLSVETYGRKAGPHPDLKKKANKEECRNKQRVDEE